MCFTRKWAVDNFKLISLHYIRVKCLWVLLLWSGGLPQSFRVHSGQGPNNRHHVLSWTSATFCQNSRHTKITNLCLRKKEKLAGFSSVSQFFLCSFPHSPSSLESTNYNHQRALSGQTVFKKINVCVCMCVCVFMFYYCSNEEKNQNNSQKKIPWNCLWKVLNTTTTAIIHQPHHVVWQAKLFS